jgi:hypothetical protein
MGEAFVCASLVSAAAVSFAGLVLLELSLFRLPYLLAVMGAVNAADLLLVLMRRESSPRLVAAAPSRRSLLPALLLLIILAFALFLRVPPSLYVHGGQDQGVYVNMSQHFVRSGGIFIHDEMLEEAFSGKGPFAEAIRPLFKLPPPEVTIEDHYEGYRVAGFYLGDKETGRVVPQFFHLHPMWLALFSLMFGFPRSVYALTVFSLLALAAVFHLSKRVFDSQAAALLTVAFLAINIIQVWTNRFPVSETIAQAFLFGGLLFYYRWRAEKGRLDMLLAAACLGLYVLTRAAGLLLLPMFVMAFWLGDSQRRDYIFYNLVFFLNLYAVAHATHFSYPYLYHQLLHKGGLNWGLDWPQAAAVGLGCIAAVNLVKVLLSRPALSPLWAAFKRRRFIILAVIGAALAVPLLRWLWRVAMLGMIEIMRLRWHTPWAQLLQVSWYVTTPGLLLAIAGGWFFAKRKLPVKPTFLALTCLGAVIIAVTAAPPKGYQFYYGRYYVAELLPFIFMFAAFGVIGLWECRLPAARGLALAVTSFLMLSFTLPYFFRPAYRVQELQGAYPALREIAALLPENSITFAGPGRNARDKSFYIRYGTSLMFIGGRCTFRHRNLPLTFQAARAFAARGHEVMLLLPAAQPLQERVFDGEMEFQPAAGGSEQIEYSQQVLGIPRSVVTRETHWYLHRFHISKEKSLPITILPDSEIAAATGFYKQTDTEWAWSEGRAEIGGIPVAAAGAPLNLTIFLGGYFPASFNPRVAVTVNGETLLDEKIAGVELRRKRQLGPIHIPAELNQGRIDIVLTTDTWIPAELGVNPADRRLLGLDVAKIVLQPETAERGEIDQP